MRVRAEHHRRRHTGPASAPAPPRRATATDTSPDLAPACTSSGGLVPGSVVRGGG